jgi:hypothetical protein
VSARTRLLIVLGLLAIGALLPATAQADFGFAPGSVSVTARNLDGTLDTQAGSHPGSFQISLGLNEEGGKSVGGALRNLLVELPPGLVGNLASMPRCTTAQFEGATPGCPGSSQVGIVQANATGLGEVVDPVYNVEPPPGVAAELGFSVFNFVPLQFASVRSEDGYGVSVLAPNIPLELKQVTETIWGTPADAIHDPDRVCGDVVGRGHVQGCAADVPHVPFLTLPTSCGPLEVTVKGDSDLNPGVYVSERLPMLDDAGQVASLQGCESVPFEPTFSAVPTTRLAQNPSGLDFELNLPNKGLLDENGISESVPRETKVALPEGMTVNPAFAEGVGVCSPGQYAAEQIDTKPGQGCPEASKIGSVLAKTPLLEEAIEGSVFLAAPYENQFDSLVALYLVARAPGRGILVKQAGQIEFDQATGQITADFDGLPPVPYSSFNLHFREGGRAPLATPAACGDYVTHGAFTPFSAATAFERLAGFKIERGSDGGACPSGGTPPFHPGLTAGSINNAAGAYSPFNVKLSRTDAEQEITHFSIKLPPGVTGKLAGIPYCSDAAIAAAKSRERQPHGGQEELDHPSCPAASQIGSTKVGAGVGQVLTYVPGKVYLAGPYNGSNLSIVAITAAKAGPFDLGTVVVREALRVNPETAEVFIDAAGSDPLPHIVNGIPVDLRDIRVYVDRPDFVLNPTNCEPTSTASTVLGSGTDFASEADDQPVTVSTRFQAADCASLGFKPRLKLQLLGKKTHRGALPAFKATLRARPGDASIGRAQVTLPPSEYLEQGHLNDVCPKSVWTQGAVPGERCPAKSVYGHARAITPLLSEPLEGPVYLRTGYGTKLPEMVAALNGQEINIDVVGIIDAVHKKGSEVSRIRTTFKAVPDAPVSSFVLSLKGAKKGLLVNSTNVCKGTHRAKANFTGQNGRVDKFAPKLIASGCKKHRRHHKRHAAHRRGAR